MKPIFLTMIAAGLMAFAAYAQPPHAKAHGKHKHHKHDKSYGAPRHAKVRYYYYPGVNVYFNPADRHYAYYQRGGWIWVSHLPPGIVIAKSPRHVVYYPGMEVWADNVVHVRQYGRPSVSVQVNL